MNYRKLVLLAAFLIYNWVVMLAQNANSVFFDSGKSDLKPESEASLKSLAEQILSYPDVDLRIEAFTDDQGEASFNQQLAQQRAEVVKAYLLKHQITPQKLDIRPIGEVSVDQKDTDIDATRRKNRRVDIYFTPISIGQMTDLATRLVSNTLVTQEIDQRKAATIQGVKGIKIEIPENAFVLMNGEPCQGPIKVTLKEALKPDDWIYNNLSTVSTNGQIMTSGGMFNLEATANGKPVKLNVGKQAKIRVPSVQAAVSDMRIFYGTQHDSTLKQPIGWRDSQTDWEDNNMNNNEKWLFVEELRKRLKGHKVTEEDFVPNPLHLDTVKLKIALSKKPVAPYVEEFVEPKIKTIENTPVKRSLLFQKRELKKRDEIIAKSEATYPKRLETYKKNKAYYEQAYSKYQKDSAAYAEATIYLAQARAAVLENEKRMLRVMAVHDYNSGVSYYPDYKKLISPLSGYHYWHSESKYYTASMNKDRQLVGLPYDNREGFLYNSTQQNRAHKAYHKGIIDSLVQAHNMIDILTNMDKDYHKWIDSRVTANVNGLNEYVADVVKLGWVNIDKFYKYDAEKARPIAMKETDEARVYLVCKQINAILPMNRSKDKTLYGFGKAPSELNYTLVAIKLKDGFPYVSIQNVKTTQTEAWVPDYKKVTVPQLKEVLASL